MTDFAVSLAIFLAICIGLAFLLLAMSNWHRWIERRWTRRAGRLPGTDAVRYRSSVESSGATSRYPSIGRADLEAEAAAAECGLYSLADHIRQRKMF